MKLFLLFLPFISCRKTIIAKLSNFNTGRLYMLEDWGFGMVEPFGTVCIGTNHEKFNSTFGETVCQILGFEELGFIGLKQEYHTYMKSKKMKTPSLVDKHLCTPNYLYAGGTCPPNAKSFTECNFRNYHTEGGACVKDVSDVFIHCHMNPADLDTKWSWNDWKSVRFGECDGCFRQQYRTCNYPFCHGQWLRVEACNHCLEPPAEDSYYNYRYENGKDYDVDYSSYSSIYSEKSDYDELVEADIVNNKAANRDRMRRLPPMRRSKGINMTEMLLNCQPDTAHLTDPDTHYKLDEEIMSENQRKGTETPSITTTTTKEQQAAESICDGTCCGCQSGQCWSRCNWYIQTPSCSTSFWYKSRRESWCYTDMQVNSCDNHGDCDMHVGSCDGLCSKGLSSPWN